MTQARDPQLDLFAEATPSEAAHPVGPAPVADATLETARHLPAGIYLGTSSWHFPGWARLVYDRLADERVLAREGLVAYAQHPLLRCAGIDRTLLRADPCGRVPPLCRAGACGVPLRRQGADALHCGRPCAATWACVRRPTPGSSTPRLRSSVSSRLASRAWGTRRERWYFSSHRSAATTARKPQAFAERLAPVPRRAAERAAVCR